MRQNPDEPVSYVIRLSERAKRDIDAEYIWVAENASLDIADEWLAELDTTLAGLSQFPRRCPAVAENFRGEVRQLLYRRQGSQMTHRVLFSLLNEQTDADDPPTVKIMHVRHTSRRPLKRRETSEIEAGD